MQFETTSNKQQSWSHINELVMTSLDTLHVNYRDPSQDLIESLVYLRKCYQNSVAPDFSIPNHRAAYLIAYHPAHVYASFKAASYIDRHAHRILDRESYSAIDIGCGPGAASAGFSTYRRLKHNNNYIDPISWGFVDRQAGWLDFLKIQCDKMDCEFLNSEIMSTIDFNNAHHSSLIGVRNDISKCNLIISQALLTELGQSGINRFKTILSHCKSKTYLLLSDLSRVKASGSHFSQAFRNAGGELSFRLIAEDSFEETVPDPPQQFKNIFDKSDNRWPRKYLHFGYCLYQKI